MLSALLPARPQVGEHPNFGECILQVPELLLCLLAGRGVLRMRAIRMLRVPVGMSFLGQAHSKLCGKRLLQGPHVCETTLVLSNLQHQRWTDFQELRRIRKHWMLALAPQQRRFRHTRSAVSCCRIPGYAPSVALSILFPTTSRPASSKHKTPCSSECLLVLARGYLQSFSW